MTHASENKDIQEKVFQRIWIWCRPKLFVIWDSVLGPTKKAGIASLSLRRNKRRWHAQMMAPISIDKGPRGNRASTFLAGTPDVRFAQNRWDNFRELEKWYALRKYVTVQRLPWRRQRKWPMCLNPIFQNPGCSTAHHSMFSYCIYRFISVAYPGFQNRLIWKMTKWVTRWSGRLTERVQNPLASLVALTRAVMVTKWL